jgi:hypothetical protein
LGSIAVLCAALCGVAGRQGAPAPTFCREHLPHAIELLNQDVYAWYGEAITADTSTDAERRLYEKSADFKARKAELKKLAAQFAECSFEFELPLSALRGGGESGSEAVTRIRGFYLFAGIVNEHDIVLNRYQNSRGIVDLRCDEQNQCTFGRVDHTEPGFPVRITGLKTTMIGDMEQFSVGYGNTGKHYFELGGFSDEQLVELERALSGADCK